MFELAVSVAHRVEPVEATLIPLNYVAIMGVHEVSIDITATARIRD